ncbi:polynucleotide kinase-phosphatase [Tundrisphaera sp. TA3]|uniref:polynucleotide kinase-phosphatase n=1 Tax=Tundrisphaera sp. TA3 TaxID=3435775 RepID=UPI003EC0451F
MTPFHINLPDPSLVVLVGASGSGKSTFAARHFRPTEVISSDRCRGMVCDDENEQGVNEQAFSVVHAIARARLALGKLAVIDATNVQESARASLIELAHQADLFAVAVVLDVSVRTCEDRNAARADRQFGRHLIRGHADQLRRSLRNLRREGFKQSWILREDLIDAVEFHRRPLWTDRRGEMGPFDIVGDVHGCMDELRELMARLGYVPDADGLPAHPEGRRLIFVGDLVDRGPDSVGVLELARRMVAAGTALCVPGNHDEKLLKKLRGKEVRIAHGLAETLAQIEALPEDERTRFEADARAFLDSLVSHYVLDGGKLVVAHAGMKAEYQGRSSSRVRSFALYGETTGETDEFGLPVRHRWAQDYRGKPLVVFGHTPVPEPDRLNHTVNIDTGCVFGGALTALRYPEDELVSVPARRAYAESSRPFLSPDRLPADGPAPRPNDDVLRIEDVAGKRIVHTRLMGNLTIRAEQSAPALEVLTRFAADPRWLVYLPPTMAPSPTAPSGPYLEHPSGAFAQFRHDGVPVVSCQEKHMGSRAVVVVLRDPAVAVARFRFEGPAPGVVLTRTGRRFFDDEAVEATFLARVAAAMEDSGLWDELDADWAVLDAEVMPWNAKAGGLLRDQYAPVGAAARADTGLLAELIGRAAARGVELGDLAARTEARAAEVAGYVEAYGRYCWPTSGLDGLKLAPFHLLAAGSRTFFDRDHAWHMTLLARLAGGDPDLIVATPARVVNMLDEADQEAAIAWWEGRTEAGMEGMVVKPLDFVARGPNGLTQPAVKVRGRSYLRIIYGPEYALPGNLDRLRARGLGRKRSLALREFALGVEALERFARGEPLYRIHECVAGILALEAEPVDPRL